MISFNCPFKWKFLTSLSNPLHVFSYALLSYLVNKYSVAVSLILDLSYVGYQDKFLDMHILYQQWSLVLEAFYLGWKGKFCGLWLSHFVLAMSYFVLNYAKQLHLINRTHSNIHPFFLLNYILPNRGEYLSAYTSPWCPSYIMLSVSHLFFCGHLPRQNVPRVKKTNNFITISAESIFFQQTCIS